MHGGAVEACCAVRRKRSPLGAIGSAAVHKALLASAVLLASPNPPPAQAQEIHLGLPSTEGQARGQRVSVADDAQIITAGKPDWIELRFHVEPGFHINSHTPHDELLIPTALAVNNAAPYRVLQTVYPNGEPLHLNIGAGETLSTYTGDFRLRLQLLADRGDSTFAATLHYQACNTASCFPPRDLPVRVALSAR